MKEFKGPDPKPAKRVKNPKVMVDRHKTGVVCALNCGKPGTLHHVLPRSQGGDDVDANLVGLCGSGTSGHHGEIEANDECARMLLGEHLLLERPDTIAYIKTKLGEEAGCDWLRRRLLVPFPTP